jgi:hypothetical protein
MKKVLMSFLAILLVTVLVACTETEDPTKVLSSIEVTTSPTTVEYMEEEMFDPTGAVITATYTWSDDTTTTEDVTDQVTYDKTYLVLGDDTVTVTYQEAGVTVTSTIPVTVNPLKELIGDGLKLTSPVSNLTISVASTSGTATSYWYTEYRDDVFYIKTIVMDESVDEGSTIFNSDGIEVMLFTDERGFGLIDGTFLINATAFGDVSIKQATGGVYQDVTDSSIDVTTHKVSFLGKYVEGYQIEIEVPYTELGLSGMEKSVTFLPGVYNNQGSIAQVKYFSRFESDANSTHTFVHVFDDNKYTEHPWYQLGYTFGDIGGLETVDAWDITNDDGTPTATSELPIIEAGTDNNAYMYRHTETELYAYVELSATDVLNNEQWGKFGLMVSSLDGTDGFLFFVDAYGDGTNMTGTNIGIVPRVDGEWVWGSGSTLASIASADDYQNGSYIELAIYRSGSIFELFVNGESVGIKSGFVGLSETEEAVVSLASFNITLMAQNYGITVDETILESHRFVTEEITNLFIGDSFLDTAFWADFSREFPDDSVNMAIGGTKAPYWIDQVATLSSLYQPENIIIHVGVNDINVDGIDGTTALSRITDLVDEIELLLPEANIYYLSIESNTLVPDKQAEYDIVNTGMETIASTTAAINYINTAAAIAPDVAQYLGTDGLHLNADGYAVFAKTIQEALGVTRVAVEQGLGDYEDYARSGGWSYETGFVQNTGGGEQQIYFDGIAGTEFAASVELSVNSILNGDPYPKVGFALKSTEKTVFFFIDVNESLDNQWANYVVRPTGSDWQWGNMGARQFVFLGNQAYNNDSFKTLEVVRMGTAIYFISDGRIVQYVEGVFAADESTQLSVMTFNLDLELQNATIYEDASFTAKLDQYQIAAKAGSMIDGDISDWDATVLSNPFHIYGSDGRTITIYTHTDNDGFYLAYNALFTGNYVTDAGNWWENTNIEFKIGMDNQRFSSANGAYSRFEDGGVRDVGVAVWNTDTSNALNNAIVELFIPWGMIEGYDKDSSFIPAGFAWKNPGEDGSIWAYGDFWYVPEADPGLRNVLVTDTGLYEAQDVTIDGDYSDWDTNIINTAWIHNPDGRTFAAAAFVGTDGFYGAFSITTPSALNLATTLRGDDWWQNPNLEIWTNDQHSRVMFYDSMVAATGRINEIAYTYDSTTNTLVIEYFISFHSLGITGTPSDIQFRIGSNSLNGGWFMPVDPNQTVTSSGLPTQP